ncbi:pentapeptide repeat-containing protein [Pleurocapsales cyanobacterium LEGE 06147]|nr:pentapeptide repeat-containing protein [Pleurocapsales cyanobacterium LEGE 06147]
MSSSTFIFNNSAAIELCKQYSLGKRQFYKAQLPRAELRRASLSRVDLREGDLNHANLKNADLSYADLRECCLNRADLSGANLTGANLAGADLARANLAGAKLIEANLNGACLSKAYLTGADLTKVNLRQGDLTGTYLNGVDLGQANLSGACYDDDTSFPANFNPVIAGMLLNCTVEELVNQFNYICQCSKCYLGNQLTIKYLHSSRPDFDWLNRFKIEYSAQIIFDGLPTETITTLQLRWFHKWINAFIQDCSQLIKKFPDLINSK